MGADSAIYEPAGYDYEANADTAPGPLDPSAIATTVSGGRMGVPGSSTESAGAHLRPTHDSVAPTSALDDIATSVGPKIRGQLADRGWTDDLIGEVVDSPTFTREVWDLTTDSAATAYARGDNFYVVVNDATGNVIQVSNINKPNWSPVWNDPKFAPPG
ncbi:MAG: hypothetical protein GY745_16685 [Actinomycetia bacterium]|nr:hypothetical protein [Actinomycetes bacterium]